MRYDCVCVTLVPFDPQPLSFNTKALNSKTDPNHTVSIPKVSIPGPIPDPKPNPT